MTTTQTHWLEYGEPVSDQHVEATHRITFETGPNEHRDDDVTHGVLHMDALEIGWGENHERPHVHDDGSLCLSAMDEQLRETVMDHFDVVE